MAVAIVIIATEFMLIWWAALIVLSIKGFFSYRRWKLKQLREIRRARGNQQRVIRLPTAVEDAIRPQGIGLGCSLCLLFLFWPLFLAQRFNDWLRENAPRRERSRNRTVT